MKKESKKYVAMIMDRHYAGPESFLFTCNHAVVGEIDEKTNIFIDNKGNEYAPILNPELLKSEIPFAYNNIYELKEIRIPSFILHSHREWESEGLGSVSLGESGRRRCWIQEDQGSS